MTNILELKKQVQEKITLDNIVEAVIYKSQKTKIPKSHAFLQQTFYQLKKEKPGLFSGFIFDESGITPFSDELDSVLFRLEASAILSTLNPTYKNYTITNFPELLEESYKKLEAKKDEIDHCASLLSELVERQVEY